MWYQRCLIAQYNEHPHSLIWVFATDKLSQKNNKKKKKKKKQQKNKKKQKQKKTLNI